MLAEQFRVAADEAGVAQVDRMLAAAIAGCPVAMVDTGRHVVASHCLNHAERGIHRLPPLKLRQGLVDALAAGHPDYLIDHGAPVEK